LALKKSKLWERKKNLCVRPHAVTSPEARASAAFVRWLAQGEKRRLLEAAVPNDPALAIGTAKELVETCCKTILEARSVSFGRNADLPALTKLAVKALELTPDDIPEKSKAVDTIRRLLSNLATVTQGIAELRNHYGTGHGKAAGAKGLGPRHAKLAVGAASTLAVFLTETHNDRPPK
jgi:hypothetical protein